MIAALLIRTSNSPPEMSETALAAAYEDKYVGSSTFFWISHKTYAQRFGIRDVGLQYVDVASMEGVEGHRFTQIAYEGEYNI